MDTAAIPLTPDDVAPTRFDPLAAVAFAVVVGLLVFGGVVGLLTLLNTSTTVTEERHTQLQVKGTQQQLQTDVRGVEGFGAGLEWQNGLICRAVGIDCTISPPGPPPPHRTREPLGGVRVP